MYHADSWKVHTGHDSGECVDIRPFRKNDNNNEGLVYSNNKFSRYDREKTKKFIGLLKKAGARTTIFNDRKIKGLSRDSSGVHNDHIHVCFGENKSAVQKTCKNGLDPATPLAPTSSIRPVARPDIIEATINASGVNGDAN